MSSEPLAKFSAAVVAERAAWSGPKRTAVVLRQGELVFEASEDRLSIPLQSVFDVKVGSVPPMFESLPGVGVTVAYETDGDRVVAAFGAEESVVRKFFPAIFKTILNDTLVKIKHPATRGGRVTGAAFESALLSIATNAVVFDADARQVRIGIDAVIGFSRTQESIQGADRPAMIVRHVEQGTALTTRVATESPRTLSLLGRYLRRQYDERLASLRQLSLADAEIKTLITIYSTRGTGVAPRDVLDFPAKQVRALLGSLQKKSLIRRGGSGPELTTTGQVVVTQYLERIND